MAPEKKYYVYTEKTLTYKEIRFFRTKAVLGGLVVLLGVLVSVYSANNLAGDLLGLGVDRVTMLSTENQVLKAQLKDFTARLEGTRNKIENLAERDNQLRLMVDLSRMDEATRTAPVGGAMQQAEFSFLGRDANAVLTGAKLLIDKLERQVRLQQDSYDAIYRKYEANKDYFAHLPAIKPSEGAYTTNGFGMRVHPVLGVWRMHEGLDIINDVGTNVYAAGDGVVQFAGHSGGGYGIVVEIDHGYRYNTVYGHLSDVLVGEGKHVKRGELIAHMGRTGLVSGPHLHYEVRYNGVKMNPVDYFFDGIDAPQYRLELASAQKTK